MKKNDMVIGCLSALGCEVLYGLSYLFTKQATQEASALSLLGWRFLLALIVMSILAVTGIIQVHLNGKDLKPLFLVSLFSPVIYFIGETVGIGNTSASESGVFLACIPVASLIASTLILKKKPSKKQVIGILITLAGVVMTVLAANASSSLSLIGYAFLLLAVVSYALYCVFVERAETYSGAEITFMMLAAGAIVFTAMAIAEGIVKGNLYQIAVLPFNNAGFLTAVLYQGIGCSILAFFLSNIAIAKIGVNRTSSFVGVATVVSIVAGAILLKEAFTKWQMIGAFVILVGVYTANTNNP